MATQIILVLLASFLQATGLISVFGIKPNLPLAVLMPLIFWIKDWRWFAVLSLTAAFIIKLPVGWEWPTAIFLAVVATSYFIKNILPWQPWFNNLALLAAATALVNLLIQGLSSFFLLEIILNLIIGVAAFIYFSVYYGQARA